MSASWERVKQLFGGALDLAADDRVAFLDRECGGDEELRGEVLSLLECDEHTRGLGDGVQGLLERHALAPSARIGGYDLERRIGAGGMGVVYAARHRTLDRVVALKVLPPECFGETELRERFLREARILAKVRHRHVVPIHEIVETGETAAIAMELVPGADLGQILRAWERDRGRPPGEVLGEALGDGPATPFPGITEFLVGVGFEVAQALAAAHSVGVLHRDVKPSNIRIRAGERAAVLVDFGVARRLGDDATITTGFVGTPSFAPPEQLAGRPVDERSDVYALALTLWRGIARTVGAGDRAASAPVPRLRDVSPSSSADLEAVLGMALEPDPRDRYASATAFAQDLGAVLDGRPVAARPRGPIKRAYHWIARDRLRLGLATILLVASALGAVLWREWPNIVAGQAVELERRVETLVHRGYGLLLEPAARGEAIAVLAEAEALAPGDPDALLGQVAALCLAGRVADARAFVASRPALHARRGELAPLLGDAPGALPSADGIEDAERLRALALVQYLLALRTGLARDFASAAHTLDRLRFVEPKTRELHLGIMAYAAAEGGEHELRARAVSGLGQLWPNSASAQTWIALASRSHDAATAARAARRAIELDPTLEPSLLGVALDHRARSGDLAGARAELAAAIARHPDSAVLHVNLGRAHFARKDYAAARDALRRAVELGPEDPIATCILGEALYRLRDPEAIAWLARATELDAHNVRAHYYLAAARHRAGDLRGALTDAERALELVEAGHGGMTPETVERTVSRLRSIVR